MSTSTQFSSALVCALPTDDLKTSLKTSKTVFDFRSSQVETLPLYLEFIHATFKQIQALDTAQPNDFVVIFMGAAVRLLSTEQFEQSSKPKLLEKLETIIEAMTADGIKLEICQLAARAFGVDLNTIVPGLLPVANGWISLIHYQARGYSLIPVY